MTVVPNSGYFYKPFAQTVLMNKRAALRTGKAVMMHRIAGKRAPLRVSHLMSFKCNLRCKFCTYWKYKTAELDAEEIMEMMSEYRSMGTASWGFLGGEPLIFPGIESLLEHSKRLGFYTSLVSNGLVVERHLDSLRGIDLLIVSIDGTESHDKIRGRGTYDRAIKAVESAKGAGVNVAVQSTLTPENLEDGARDLRPLLDRLKEIEVRWLAQPLHKESFMEACQPTSHTVMDSAFLEESADFMLAFKRENPEAVMYSRAEVEWIRGKSGTECRAGELFCSILPNGLPVPCMFKLPEGAMGGLDRKMKDHRRQVAEMASYPSCRCSMMCASKVNQLTALNLEAIRSSV